MNYSRLVQSSPILHDQEDVLTHVVCYFPKTSTWDLIGLARDRSDIPFYEIVDFGVHLKLVIFWVEIGEKNLNSLFQLTV